MAKLTYPELPDKPWEGPFPGLWLKGWNAAERGEPVAKCPYVLLPSDRYLPRAAKKAHRLAWLRGYRRFQAARRKDATRVDVDRAA